MVHHDAADVAKSSQVANPRPSFRRDGFVNLKARQPRKLRPGTTTTRQNTTESGARRSRFLTFLRPLPAICWPWRTLNHSIGDHLGRQRGAGHVDRTRFQRVKS